MKSSGGVTSTRTVRRAPVETALSGPAAGAVGAAYVGAGCGHPNLIGIDIGGTSADISLIHGGEPGLTTNGRIGGWPVGLPMVDIVTIGAGGGSIARVLDTGALTVGPQSAGALPGPVCYGRGGVEPTVTDAHLVLGHLPPYLLGGSFPLDVEAARGGDPAPHRRAARARASRQRRAASSPSSTTTWSAPSAWCRSSAATTRATSRCCRSAARGRCTAARWRGCSACRRSSCRRVPACSRRSGLLVSNLKAEFTRTCLQKAGAFDAAGGRARVRRAGGRGRRLARRRGRARRRRAGSPGYASLRYQHQGFELNVPWASHEGTEAAAAATVAAFHRLHERLYTFAQEDTPVEIVTLRVDARGVFPAPAMLELPPAGPLEEARTGTQAVLLETGRVEAAIYARERLGAGARIDGPAILTQLDATTLLLPGEVGTVDRLGNLIVDTGRLG